jgi:hypothetical protein
VAVAAVVAAVAAAVGVMVILTMGLVVVITATVAGEAIDGNCSLIGLPIIIDSGSVGRLDAHFAPLTHTLRSQIVAVSIRVQ